MEYIEVKAEVFRVIRANQDLGAHAITKLIKESIPTANHADIVQALIELADIN